MEGDVNLAKAADCGTGEVFVIDQWDLKMASWLILLHLHGDEDFHKRDPEDADEQKALEELMGDIFSDVHFFGHPGEVTRIYGDVTQRRANAARFLRETEAEAASESH